MFKGRISGVRFRSKVDTCGIEVWKVQADCEFESLKLIGLNELV